MKKAEIAARVFEAINALAPSPVAGGPIVVSPDVLAGLSLVPWFCDLSVHWAVRLTLPAQPLKKTTFPKIPGVLVTPADAGGLLVGVPGDGITPSTHALFPLAKAVATLAQPGLQIELATANLGIVKRDVDARAETSTDYGNHLYRGVVDRAGQWQIADTHPPLDASTLRLAIACGSLLPNNGPWQAQDPAEAYAILMQWLLSREANINPAAVKHFVRWQDGTFHTDDVDMLRRFYGLALGFFRHRLAGSPFRWPEPAPYLHPLAELEATARAIIAAPGPHPG
jgi:hypothetical protein